MARMARGTALVVLAALGACAPKPKTSTTQLTSYERAEANAWAGYDRAAALDELGRTDAAVTGFREAEAHFGDRDPHGKAVSIYGRARALDEAGRCDEAKTAYEEYARYVEPFDPRASKMARDYAKECRATEHVLADPALNEMVSANTGGRYHDALAAAKRVGEPASGSAWFEYNRAVALAGLGRIDAAVAAYRTAEARFGSADPSGRAIAVYGRARALDRADRCAEAKVAYADYAALVRKTSPRDADDAETVARACSR